MAILAGDIKLVASQVMDDVAEGGGSPTSTVIQDGSSNSIFNDISELDRAGGRVNLRKVFAHVQTPSVDGYFGANIILADPPDDPKVSISLFKAASVFDQRTDAKNWVEAYLAMGAESRWMLYGNHLVGQRTVQIHCPHGLTTPAVDEVICLVDRDDQAKNQYVRISRLVARSDNVQFEDTKGVFYRDVITLETSAPLTVAFRAATMERFTSDWFSPPTRIHTTVAADAASYYGASKLKFSANIGDLTLKTQSIYTQIVPSAFTETPIVNAKCSPAKTVIVPVQGASTTNFTISNAGLSAGVPKAFYFGHPVAKGSVSVAIAGVTLQDNSNGQIVLTSGYSADVDYEVGSVVLSSATASSASATFSALPAGAVSPAAHTDSISITPINRGYTYVKTLSPVPGPGTVSVSYMAQGQWYGLTDDGLGHLVSDQEGVGTGSVDYATGAVLLTLGSLPDAETALLYSWGTPANYSGQVGTQVFKSPTLKFTIPNGAIEPGTLAFSYLAGGVAQSVADNAAGALTGQATGWVDYANGIITFTPSKLPDSSSDLTVAFSQGGVVNQSVNSAGAVTNFTTAQPILPKSLSLTFFDQFGYQHVATDDGVGGIELRSSTFSKTHFDALPGSSKLTSSITATVSAAGSVNYATGSVSLAGNISVSYLTLTGGVFSSQSAQAAPQGAIYVRYRVASDTAGVVQNVSIPLPDITIDLLPSVSNSIVPGSIRFVMGGTTYVDRAGTIVSGVSNTTNSGVVSGSVNYATGIMTLTNYTGGATNSTPTVSCLTRKGVWTAWKMSFRTAGAPLQSASLYVSAIRASDSVTISGNGQADGSISGTQTSGVVDYTTGIATVRFGSMVTAAGNEGEWWYDPADVVAGQIFKPELVLADTASYNAVATSSLPLSAEILGLDPVRLPVDGRVPIFRKGDFVVVGHTGTIGPFTLTNGQTKDCGRVRLSRVRVIGNDGNVINTGYSEDLEAGTVTFNNVSSYSQPVTIEHRIEDMALVSDVQINGELSITRALTHDYPVDSFVSSALVAGDMKAYVSNLFDQATWNGSWLNTLYGSQATATYNDVLTPIEVTNDGAITERWMVRFTSTTNFEIVGENVGVIGSGSISADIAPINPATGKPYFTLRYLGWGAGWSAGNILRFNTVGAIFPVWVIRSIQQGPETVTNDSFTLLIRGDVDRP